ncbi:hypothetical protein ACHAWF_011034 [Thalassiosira exigua]
MNIAFGDCASVGDSRHKYALVLVDRTTRYNWVFSLRSLSSLDILSALKDFRAAAGRLSTLFRCDCDENFFDSAVRSFLHDNGSRVEAAPSGRQSSNGLIESHWKIMVHMARAYLTEKQMPRRYWYFAIKHAARMMNMIPSKYCDKLTSPFMLVHGIHRDQRTWTRIFSICYFHHERDGDVRRSHTQAHTMDGVVVGRSPTSNALLVYNPRTCRYYEPDSYRIDPYRLPSSMYPDVKYDGGLISAILRDDNPAIEEPFPPGTRVEDLDPDTRILRAGTVIDIPMDPERSPHYLIVFDDGTSKSISAKDMPGLIPKPPEFDVADDDASALPSFLCPNSQVIFEHNGEYHKSYITRSSAGYRFSSKSHVNKKKEDWGVPLPNLKHRWAELCTEGILVPGHSAHSFVRSSSAPSTTFDLVAQFVSAINLQQECPASLLCALAESHPDCGVWLQSFYEEKESVESMGTFQRLNLDEYQALREKGASCAIPAMCVLTIKKEENLLPLRAKSRIAVLGNHKDRVWSKSEKFTPVLRSDLLCLLYSMAVEQRRVLKQGDFKNAFCNGDLPPGETTIVKPPVGDPDAAPHEYWPLRKTLYVYGLRRSPRHWFDKIKGILAKLGLRPNSHDPCLFSGRLVDPNDPSASTDPCTSSDPSDGMVTMGLYVDDFVYFSSSDETEKKFERLLAQHIMVDFMGTVEWFLGIHFQWNATPSSVSVHLNQAGFAANTVESFNLQDRNVTPDATPYRSGLPIDGIAESDEPKTSSALEKRRREYRRLVGCIGWIAMNTRPDLAPVHSFLSSYNNKPAPGHMKAALYAFHYVHSTHDYGISFTSKEKAPMHTYIHYPDSSDVEAYDDAKRPSGGTSHKCTTYSDACWGSQLGNSVPMGTWMPLFKFCSMSGGIIFRSGGPIAWFSERQERSSHSSCEAEIRATDHAARDTVSVRHLISGLRALGYPIADDESATTLYNDNSACFQWSHNMNTKRTRHMDNKETAVREWVQDGSLKVVHVRG